MRAWLSPAACILTLAALSSFLCRAADADKEKKVRLELEQVGPPALPYQAVRLRLTVRNVGKKPIGPVNPVEVCFNCWLKGPGDIDFRKDRIGVCWSSKKEPIVERPFPAAPSLAVQERTSVSFAIAADWSRDGPAKPLFPRPGKYAVRCSYLLDAETSTSVEKVLEFEVKEPKGEDRAVYKLLAKDPALVDALLEPADAIDKTAPAKLKEIVRKYPDSSYADYARLALARHYYTGGGSPRDSWRVAAARAADELAPLTQTRVNNQAQRFEYVRFAYQPAALMLMRVTDARSKENTEQYLNRHHTDAIEWLQEAAKGMTAKEWDAFRKRVPVTVEKFTPPTVQTPGSPPRPLPPLR